MLVVNKNSMINHTLAVVVFMCGEKSGSGKRGMVKRLRFYVFVPCRVDLISHFLLAGQ